MYHSNSRSFRTEFDIELPAGVFQRFGLILGETPHYRQNVPTIIHEKRATSSVRFLHYDLPVTRFAVLGLTATHGEYSRLD